MIPCLICGEEYKEITWCHLEKHGVMVSEYRKRYPDAPIRSKETVRKRSLSLSRALKGRRPPEHIMKLAHEKAAERNRGRSRPPEVKKKISETKRKRKERLGYVNSPETCERIRQSKLGTKLSEKWKENISEGVKRFYEKNPKKRSKMSKTMKEMLDKNPELIEKSASRLRRIWDNDRESMLMKQRDGKKNHTSRHIKEISNSLREFEEKGFRCIPIEHMFTKVLPDFIAIKDDEVIAVEVEVGKNAKPKPQKYEGVDYYDDVIWIVIKEA